MTPNHRYRRFITAPSLMALSAVIAALFTLLLFQANFKVVIGIVAVLMLITGLVVSGNIRLFCLWGLILTAPPGSRCEF